jgi:hypothetical protein
VEVHHLGKIFDGTLDDLEDIMKSNGYKFFSKIHINHIYIKDDFVPKRLRKNFQPFLEL